MKYVMFEVNGEGGKRKVPIIFPDSLVHSMMAEQFERVLRYTFKGCMAKPVSAGMVSLTGQCHGESETLKLKADKADSSIINAYDYLHGV